MKYPKENWILYQLNILKKKLCNVNGVWNLDEEGLTYSDLSESVYWKKLNECHHLVNNGQIFNKDFFTNDEVIFKRLDFYNNILVVTLMKFTLSNDVIIPFVGSQRFILTYAEDDSTAILGEGILGKMVLGHSTSTLGTCILGNTVLK